jgi:hypothetical protein
MTWRKNPEARDVTRSIEQYSVVATTVWGNDENNWPLCNGNLYLKGRHFGGNFQVPLNLSTKASIFLN